MKSQNVELVIDVEEKDGKWIARCPATASCGMGSTEAEAMQQLEDCIEIFFDTSCDHEVLELNLRTLGWGDEFKPPDPGPAEAGRIRTSRVFRVPVPNPRPMHRIQLHEEDIHVLQKHCSEAFREYPEARERWEVILENHLRGATEYQHWFELRSRIGAPGATDFQAGEIQIMQEYLDRQAGEDPAEAEGVASRERNTRSALRELLRKRKAEEAGNRSGSGYDLITLPRTGLPPAQPQGSQD